MGAGGTWRAVCHKHVLIAFTGAQAEISAWNSDERELGIAARETFVNGIGYRTGEMTGDRQKSDSEFILIGPSRPLCREQMQVQPPVHERDNHEPHDRNPNQCFPKRHGTASVMNQCLGCNL